MSKQNRCGYTGHLFEEEVLGRCSVVWEGEYVPFHKALRLVKRNQPSGPSRPSCPTARSMYKRVALALGVADWAELEFYTAVGSPLDVLHGVDAFLVWRGHMVTIDVTMNPKKTEESAKADLVFHDGDDLNEFVARITCAFCAKEEGRVNA